MLDALLDHGADIEADGAVIAGGTPLEAARRNDFHDLAGWLQSR